MDNAPINLAAPNQQKRGFILTPTPAETREEATRSTHKAIDEICATIGADLAGHVKAQCDKLTDGELRSLRTQPGHYRAARLLIVLHAADRISQQWNAESYAPDLRRLKKWLRNRY